MSEYQLHEGNAMAVLQELEPGLIQTCVTSPPYWGLRDYGDPGQDWPAVEYTLSLGGVSVPVSVPAMTAALGLESKPAEYVAHLVAIFREVRRVLRDDGTLWINIGDTYASNPGNATVGNINGTSKKSTAARLALGPMSRAGADLKQKDLVGIPWLLAYALRSDGWYLRSDIIWHKANPMPESVTDRPTRGHEYVFLLAKSSRYRCDMEAIAERAQDPETQRGKMRKAVDGGFVEDPKLMRIRSGLHHQKPRSTRNARTVWKIASQPYKHHSTVQHFAVMPPELARRCVVAGAGVGDKVLDPFAGACTVGVVAIENDREFVGIELSESYAQIGRERMDLTRSRFGKVAAADAKPGQQIGMFG